MNSIGLFDFVALAKMNPVAPVKPQWEVLGEEFVKAYYLTFDGNRDQLAQLYAVSGI